MILHHTPVSHTIMWELVWNMNKRVAYHLSKMNIKGISYNKELIVHSQPSIKVLMDVSKKKLCTHENSVHIFHLHSMLTYFPHYVKSFKSFKLFCLKYKMLVQLI